MRVRLVFGKVVTEASGDLQIQIRVVRRRFGGMGSYRIFAVHVAEAIHTRYFFEMAWSQGLLLYRRELAVPLPLAQVDAKLLQL